VSPGSTSPRSSLRQWLPVTPDTLSASARVQLRLARNSLRRAANAAFARDSVR
jgi:hypothetical protein